MLAYAVILSCLLTSSFCNDDYKYYQKVMEQERIARAQNPSSFFDGLYVIQSAENGLYLTARRGRGQDLGQVVLNKYTDAANQLWTATKFDTNRGYNLKPYANEYNVVTSSLVNNAHAYNPWEFKKQDNSNFIIFNTLNKRCLQSSGLKKPVTFESCKPASKLQQWKLQSKL